MSQASSTNSTRGTDVRSELIYLPDHPDAALIAACERHMVNHTRYNTLARVARIDPDKDPTMGRIYGEPRRR